jgi:4-carboxymuconolactone decarboxylase
VSGPADGEGDEFARALFAPFRASGDDVPSLWWSLATAPAMLRAWRGMAGVLMDECVSPASVRELAILRIAHLLDNSYQWDHHIARAHAAGVTDEQIDALAHWRDDGGYDAATRATLAVTDALTDDAKVARPEYDELARHFDDAQIVELVLTVSFYNCVCRFVGALYDA